jgi:predicted regulator of Ras-like GTPase activity (Roadblock/LC7/MglB family)
MGDVILYKEDVDRLNFLLKNFIADSKILSALLITKDTRVLACQGSLSTSDTGALAALLVGSFASTQAIAGLIGETEFDMMSHVGKTRNLVISLVNEDTILASIFDKNSSADIITRVVARHADVLKKTLNAIGANTAEGLFDLDDNSPPNEEDDFELRTDALVKSMQSEQFSQAADAPVKMMKGNLHGQPAHVKEATRTQGSKEMIDHNGPKKSQPLSAPPEVKKPPDTKKLVSESSVSSEDYKVYAHNAAINSPPGKIDPLPEVKSSPSQEPAKGETVLTSMHYLQNKAREGALYYHHDKAFFKKFFKTPNKKKA